MRSNDMKEIPLEINLGKVLKDLFEAEATATRRLELLKRLIEQEGMIVFAEKNCGCEDCTLVLEIKKEIADDND